MEDRRRTGLARTLAGKLDRGAAGSPGFASQNDRGRARMRIAIDTHAIGSTLTGNERYIQNLAEQLLALDRSNEYFFFFSQEEARRMWEGRAPNLTTYKVSKNPLLRLGIDFPRQLWRLRPHLFHYQYTGPLFR